MSTILKALKQAEKDCPDPGDENSPSFNVRTALRSRMQQQKQSSFFSLGSVVAFVALVIFMAISAYSLFFNNNNIPPQTQNNGKQSKILDTQPDNKKDQKQTVTESAAKPSGLPDASIEILPETVTKPPDMPKPPDKNSVKPELTNQAPAVESFSKKAKEEITTSPDNSPLTGAKKSASPKPVDAPKQEILPLENDSLRIQAISWSEKPESRITVIDNRVLSEGDSVQNYRLVLIEKDSVILHYSGTDYRLKFKSR